MHRYNISYLNFFKYLSGKHIAVPEDIDNLWTEEQKEQLLGRFIDEVASGANDFTPEMGKVIKMYYGFGETRRTSGEAARELDLPDGAYVYRRLNIARDVLVSTLFVARNYKLKWAFNWLFWNKERVLWTVDHSLMGSIPLGIESANDSYAIVEKIQQQVTKNQEVAS